MIVDLLSSASTSCSFCRSVSPSILGMLMSKSTKPTSGGFERLDASIPSRANMKLTVPSRTGVCTENLIPVDDVMESPKLAE
jgi:hypothetical protein